MTQPALARGVDGYMAKQVKTIYGAGGIGTGIFFQLR